ncbi:methyltransferase family protein [Winogradskyella pacifica]|uniref:Methyltransferase family protein n=1 Tax=Winogradskyella pacifica TaxID=664642 RepID=A0A3D9N1E5_9FLAO|nr:class I SAM-dependent methyltransferase [Winogradskyella pacifica]REE25488.1 methyltransferase family protein [Winogradskyella pacifica]
MKGKIRSVLVGFLTNTVGSLLVTLRPQKVKQLSEKGLTLVLGDNLSLSERLMRRAILKKIEKNEDHDQLAQLHKTYWAKQGDHFVNNTEDNLKNIHLPAYKDTLDVLKNEISNAPMAFEKLVEIGTGNGSVLNYLSSNYPDIKDFIGIDLSEEQTKINQINYKDNSKLKFIGGDVLDWLENQQQGNFVFLTFRGVLEYFTQQQLIVFFKKLNALGNIIFYAIEPTDSEHNYETNQNSKVYGVEGSFSHNYEKLFKDTGFNVWYSDAKSESGHPYIIKIVGSKNF